MAVGRNVHQNEMNETMEMSCTAVDQLYHHLPNHYCHQYEDFANLGNIYKYRYNSEINY